MIKQTKIKYPANTKQIQVFHAILANNGIMDTKEDIVWNATNRRTQRVSEMSYGEMKELLAKLQAPNSKNQDQNCQVKTPDKGDVMRKKILHYCHLMGWHLTPTLSKGEGARSKIDWKRIDEWCVKYGHCHKALQQHSYEELPTLVSQFEEVYKHYLRFKI